MGRRAIGSYWQWLRKRWLAIASYAALSPDLHLRRQVNRSLTTRPAMTLDEWHTHFWQPRQVSKDIAAFTYDRLQSYSGLAIAHVLPSDRLERDLKFTLVCWFDWQTQLCDDFYQRFGVDISACLGYQPFVTIEDLVLFLQQQSTVLHS
jgi:hypothetical protein